MDTGTQCHRAVNTATSHDNISALIQRLRNRKRAEIGIGTGDRFARWRGLTGEHFCGLCGQDLIQLGHQVVASDDCYLERQPCALNQLPDCAAACLGVHAARITYKFDARIGDSLQMRRHNRVDKVSGIAFFRIRGFGAGHDRHRDLSEIIKHDEVEVTLRQKLGECEIRLAPITRGTTDTNHTVRPCLR